MDRDGVINKKLEDDYVKSWSEFEFLQGVPESIARLSKHFGRIIIVSNQQGIGKGLMSKMDVDLIHDNMRKELLRYGAKITAIYYCPALASDNDPCRKPETGMGLQAQADFPEIDFSKSVMVGDSDSDILFGRALGMNTVWLRDSIETSGSADHYAKDLADLTAKIEA